MEDLLQEAWVLFYERRARYDPDGTYPFSWLKQQMEWSVQDAVREFARNEDYFYQGEWRKEWREWSSWSPEKRMMVYEEERRLQQAPEVVEAYLQQVPPRCREVLTMWAEGEGIGPRIIGERLGLTEGRISQILKQYAPGWRALHAGRRRTTREIPRARALYRYTEASKERLRERGRAAARHINQKKTAANNNTIANEVA